MGAGLGLWRAKKPRPYGCSHSLPPELPLSGRCISAVRGVQLRKELLQEPSELREFLGDLLLERYREVQAQSSV